MDGDLPKIAKPAQRALASAEIDRLDQLAKKTEAEIAALHGMGSSAMKVLEEALKAEGLGFKK
jgi:hypothetical protein